MDRKASVCNPLDLERMLIDERAEPRNLRLSLLESITNNFSDDLQIGSGGFAVVYKGILQNGAVAVKKLSKTFDVDERKFQREVDSLMRAKHKNIVRFLGYCSDTQGIVHKFNGRHVMAEERQRFLCFEFVPLGSLDKYISDASGGLDWRTRYQIIRGICEGLHYLHQQRIVHLDLKPGNILLDQYMLPKIADFGLSKCFDEKQSGAVTSNPCGTRGYMAPESHDGVITLKSDIYSLGIIIIEILTGQRGCPVIENVLESWSIRFKTLKGDTRLEPIRVCFEIGMECTDFNPTKRTDTGRIIARLDEMELKYGIIVADLCTSSETEVLFKHLQEQLLVTEEKLRVSRYQITPWHTGLSNNSPPVPTNPPAGKAVVTTSKSSLDIVSQTAYPQVQSPMSSPVQARGEWGVLGNKNHQEVPTKNAEQDDMEGTSLSSRNQFRMDFPAQVSQHDSHAVQFDFETQSHNPPFKGLSRTDVLDGYESAERQNAQESSARWVPGDSTNLSSGLEDANPSYPYLPTVLEEPGSSFSEATEDDPLPGIYLLQITGEPFPGRELQASGYPINGTTTCNFEWVRHLEDGSVNFIEGASKPSYVVTADDVDTFLSIDVQPLDDRKRKGAIIKVYANEQRKITCDPETKELIKRTLEIGHVTYEVQVQLPEVRFLDMWEPAILAIKREGYSIKCNGQRGVVITEKFQQETGINIPYGSLSEFSITSADGVDYNLKPAENTLLRDTIVLVLRLFKNMAVKRRRGKNKGLFFR